MTDYVWPASLVLLRQHAWKDASDTTEVATFHL